jgi:hypothetical protein
MAQYDSIWFPEVKVLAIDDDQCPECGGEDCVEVLEDNEYFCRKCRQSWKTLQCPECHTENIEVVEGALLHYIANHSGQCNECGCIWKID